MQCCNILLNNYFLYWEISSTTDPFTNRTAKRTQRSPNWHGSKLGKWLWDPAHQASDRISLHGIGRSEGRLMRIPDLGTCENCEALKSRGQKLRTFGTSCSLVRLWITRHVGWMIISSKGLFVGLEITIAIVQALEGLLLDFALETSCTKTHSITYSSRCDIVSLL